MNATVNRLRFMLDSFIQFTAAAVAGQILALYTDAAGARFPVHSRAYFTFCPRIDDQVAKMLRVQRKSGLTGRTAAS